MKYLTANRVNESKTPTLHPKTLLGNNTHLHVKVKHFLKKHLF